MYKYFRLGVGLLLAGFAGNMAGKVMNQEEKAIRNVIVGILGGIIGEECWMMLTNGFFPGLIDNMLIIMVCGFILSMLVCLIFKKKPKQEQQNIDGEI